MGHAPQPPGRVLVTGLGGFTGRYVLAALQQRGWQVWGLGAQLAPADLGIAPQHYLQADLLDAPTLAHAVALASPQAVVHLAAIAFVGHGDADAFYRTNLLGTRHLLAALAALPRRPARVLLASSANVYGNQTEGMLDEAAVPQPANDYAVSKLAMEHMARLWAVQLPITIVRPFNYTGVGQSADFLLPKIVEHFKRRAAAIELGNLDVWRDFSDVRAVADAYARLLAAPAAVGATVNVCSGHSHSLREVLAMAEQITGHQLPVQVNPAFVRANEVKTLLGNAARLRSLIGADWTNPPLADTLRWMLEAP
ncbi:MAG: NAD-dependent epimerase/dehydratase family protein [Giesbergeria sp.]|jgi:nucleoside-diphosphate-sugar epimerase|nr:NAD-dependent epimerase/dehydratase family protein [Giesbergeria sp.]